MKLLNRVGFALMLAATVAVFLAWLNRYGTPSQQKSRRLDAIRLSGVVRLADAILDKAKTKPKVDWEKLANAADWTHPVTKERYTYRKVSPIEFEICTTFLNRQEDVERQFGKIEDARLKFRPGPNCFRFNIKGPDVRESMLYEYSNAGDYWP